jgi:hypothetical protein
VLSNGGGLGDPAKQLTPTVDPATGKVVMKESSIPKGDGTFMTNYEAAKELVGRTARKENWPDAVRKIADEQLGRYESLVGTPPAGKKTGATVMRATEDVPAGDLTLGQLIKREGEHSAQGIVMALPSDVLKLPGQLKRLWETPIKDITLDQLSEIPEDIIPPAVKIALRAAMGNAPAVLTPQGTIPFSVYGGAGQAR